MHVLISGASIAGPSLGYWLDRYGMDVTIVELASTVRPGGYPINPIIRESCLLYKYLFSLVLA